jgi:hypothetical protein
LRRKKRNHQNFPVPEVKKKFRDEEDTKDKSNNNGADDVPSKKEELKFI